MNLFKVFKKSLYSFDEYINLIKISNLKTYFYTIFLALILTLTLFYPLTLSYIKIGGVSNVIAKYIPEFKIENDKIYVDKLIDYNYNDKIKIIIDTKNNKKIEDYFEFNNVILVDSNNITFKSFNITEVISIKQLSSAFNIYSKSELINNISFIKTIMLYIILLTFFLTLISSHIITILIIIILSFITKIIFFSSKNSLLSFDKIFKLVTLANTMPYVLNFIFSIFNLYMPTFIYLGVFISIIIFSTKSIKLKDNLN